MKRSWQIVSGSVATKSAVTNNPFLQTFLIRVGDSTMTFHTYFRSIQAVITVVAVLTSLLCCCKF